MENKEQIKAGTIFEGLIMDKQLTYQLLKLIKHNGNVWELIYEGYEFGQITYFLDTLNEKRYISTNETGKTFITLTGENFLSQFESDNGIKQYSKWILPRNEMWHKPINPTFIYIPKE